MASFSWSSQRATGNDLNDAGYPITSSKTATSRGIS